MNPARAMGTFLRTWRAEWAHLSRAQLAVAVAARGKPRKKVTPDIIREWEDGQPPASTAELDALLQVMREHGLTNPEVGQFQTAVFAACLDRHYPDLYEGESLADRPDIDEIAEAVFREGQWPGRSGTSAVHLVAAIHELREAVTAAVPVGEAGTRTAGGGSGWPT